MGTTCNTDLTSPRVDVDRASRAQTQSAGLGQMLRSAADLPEIRWAATATVLFAVGGVAQLAGAPSLLWWTLYLLCYAAGG